METYITLMRQALLAVEHGADLTGDFSPNGAGERKQHHLGETAAPSKDGLTDNVTPADATVAASRHNNKAS